MKAVFTVLHYKDDRATKRCVRSLLRLKGIEECRILVYDNGSLDGSGERVSEYFSGVPLFECHISHTPQGFSRGNNEVYEMAKTFLPRFIIVLNNDICIRDRDFLIRLEALDQENDFFIIGPDIYNPLDGTHQGPLYASFPSREQILQDVFAPRKELEVWERLEGQRDLRSRLRLGLKLKRESFLFFLKNLMPVPLLEAVRTFFRQMFPSNYVLSDSQKDRYGREHRDAVLQGSCIIVTRRYMEKERVLFEPETKFYHEELLLALKCRTLGYSTLYTPRLQVYHFHGAATRKRNHGDIRKSLEFACRNMEESWKILDGAMENNPWV